MSIYNVGLRDAVARLKSSFHAKVLSESVRSILGRIHPSGYVPESLTGGVYNGMFPRTLCALARLFLAIGKPELLEAPIDYCLRSTLGNGLLGFPHIIGPPAADGGCLPAFIDDLPQPDGIANAILAWAMLALSRERNAFENRTYEDVAGILDRLASAHFFANRAHWRCDPGLVLNTHFEHSRDWQFWCCYDFLTQSFVASALGYMADVAQRRGDGRREERWRKILGALETNIAKAMVIERHGKKIYLEMLLPTGRKPVPFDGLGWVNLAAIPADWRGVDQEIFRNTIREWRRHAAIKFDGVVVTACDWTPEGHTGETYGKMLGWELVFLAREGCWDEVAGLLDFLEKVNGDGIYAEIFRYGDDQYGQPYNPGLAAPRWHVRDRGNGEQCAWLCWSMTEVRRLAGLSNREL